MSAPSSLTPSLSGGLKDSLLIGSKSLSKAAPPSVWLGWSLAFVYQTSEEGCAIKVPSLHMSTDSVAERDRASYWRDLVCETFVELECEVPQSIEFRGSLRTMDLGDFRVSAVDAAAQQVRRTRRAISASSSDHFLLSLQTRGRGTIIQDDRVASLGPGDFALYDSTRPYRLQFDNQFGQIVLQLPRKTVTDRLIDVHMLTALRVNGGQGVGLLASNFIRHLHQEIEAIGDLSSGRLKASAVDLLATAFAEQAGVQNLGTESQVMLRRRALAYVDEHLADNDLSCRKIAEVHGISERQLRRAFEGTTSSLSEWIWARRLEQAKRDLVDPLKAPLSITAIAYDVGYRDLAHFSRSFRARFDCTPRDWRNDSAS